MPSMNAVSGRSVQSRIRQCLRSSYAGVIERSDAVTTSSSRPNTDSDQGLHARILEPVTWLRVVMHDVLLPADDHPLRFHSQCPSRHKSSTASVLNDSRFWANQAQQVASVATGREGRPSDEAHPPSTDTPSGDKGFSNPPVDSNQREEMVNEREVPCRWNSLGFEDMSVMQAADVLMAPPQRQRRLG